MNEQNFKVEYQINKGGKIQSKEVTTVNKMAAVALVLDATMIQVWGVSDDGTEFEMKVVYKGVRYHKVTVYKLN